MTTVVRALHLTDAGAQSADVRRFFAAMYDGRVGVISTGMAVTEKSGTPDMSVDIAAGFALAAGTESASQGSYVIENDGVQNATVTTASATQIRWDLVCAYVTDTDEGAGTSTSIIGVVTGPTTGSPADPTVPDNACVIARIVVPQSAGSITDSDITDLRTSYTGQSKVGRIGGGLVAYDTGTTAWTNAYSTAAAVALSGISDTFTARTGYVYKVTLKSGTWLGASTLDFAVARFRITGTGLSPDPIIGEFSFSDLLDGNSYTGELILDALSDATDYTIGVSVQCMIPAASSVTFHAESGSDLQVWVTEIEDTR